MDCISRIKLELVIQSSLLAQQKIIIKKSLKTKSNPIKSFNQSMTFSLVILTCTTLVLNLASNLSHYLRSLTQSRMPQWQNNWQIPHIQRGHCWHKLLIMKTRTNKGNTLSESILILQYINPLHRRIIVKEWVTGQIIRCIFHCSHLQYFKKVINVFLICYILIQHT